MNRKIAIVAIAVFVTGVTLTAFAIPVSAQSSNNNETTGTSETVVDLNPNLRITNVNYDFSNESIVITFDSDFAQSVTVQEAVADPNQDYQELREETYQVNGKTRVTFDTSVTNDMLGVTVSSGKTIMLVEEKDTGFNFGGGEYTAQQVMVIMTFTGFVSITLAVGLAYKEESKVKNKITTVVEKREQ